MSAMKKHDFSSQYVLIYDAARIYDMKYMKSMKSCYQLYGISWKYTCIFFISTVKIVCMHVSSLLAVYKLFVCIVDGQKHG
jgi:hypothetical protein